MLGLKLIHISKRGPWAQFHLSLAHPDKYNSDIIDDSKNLFEWKHLKKYDDNNTHIPWDLGFTNYLKGQYIYMMKQVNESQIRKCCQIIIENSYILKTSINAANFHIIGYINW